MNYTSYYTYPHKLLIYKVLFPDYFLKEEVVRRPSNTPFGLILKVGGKVWRKGCPLSPGVQVMS